MKAGDTVRLKSGGPVMTVRWVEDDEAMCEWFEKTDLKSAVFSISSLVHVNL